MGSLEVGTGNGLGLSMGTGFEWGAFAERLGSGQAVFVYEPAAELMRMGLEVCDLAGWLESGKIILLTGAAGAAGEMLARFLNEHVGFDAPSVLHPLATIAPERRNEILASGEAIVRRVVTERHGLVNSLAGQMEGVMGKMDGEAIAMTVTTRYEGERPLQGELKEGRFELRLDHHASASMAARLKALIEKRPERILSDVFRTQIGCVPAGVEVETWVPPMAGAGYWDRVPNGEELTGRDRIVVHGAAQKERLVERGIGKAEIEIRLLARPRSGGKEARERLAIRHRVALVGDLMEMDMEAMGITLPTHQAVFVAAHEMVAADYLGVHVGQAGDILRRALSRAEVAVTAEGAADPSLREPMLRIVRDVIIPNVPLMTLARELMREKVALRLIGEWPGFEGSEAVVVEKFAKSGGNVWGDVAVLVVLSPTGMVSPVVLEGAMAGTAMVSPAGAWDKWEGGLSSLLKAEVEFARPGAKQFLKVVKERLREFRIQNSEVRIGQVLDWSRAPKRRLRAA